jgi:hypothetical protein
MSKKRKSVKGAKKGAKSAKASGAARKSGGPPRLSARAAMAAAGSTSKGVTERVAALNAVSLAATTEDENVPKALDILGDPDQPSEVRLAALEALQTASFSVVSFAPFGGRYVATLRKLADDPNPQLRESALGLLARRKDGSAQKKLLEGLKDPAKALVAPETALQLLSYDPHAAAYAAARKIIDDPPSDDSRREALRLLAADAKSAPLFEKLLRDKGEKPAIRRLAASAIHSINPRKFQEHARELVLDPTEEDDIRAVSLTALTYFGDNEAVAGDEALQNQVSRLGEASAASVKKGARRFTKKYGDKDKKEGGD